MRKVKINDNQGKSIEVDIDQFKKHLDEYHSQDQVFMMKMVIILQ